MKKIPKKTLRIKVDTYYKYLSLFDGIFGLTKTEKIILEVFFKERFKAYNADPSEEPNVFSWEYKCIVSDRLERSDPNTLNNYIKVFKDKGAIIPIDGVNGGYYINRILIPRGKSEEINFLINV